MNTSNWISAAPIILSVLAFGVSVISLILSRRTWRETYRPIIIARVTTEGAGNLAILYNLLVENTGNRPATDIQLQVDRDVLKSAMKPDCSLSTAEITNCFDPHYTIPVLGNGQSTLTAFGKTTDKDDCMWIADSRFPITIKYSDLDERRYRSKVTLFIFDSTGFAGFHYADPR